MPMVDHIKQSQNNIERMKQVYQQLAHYRGKSEYTRLSRFKLLSLYKMDLYPLGGMMKGEKIREIVGSKV